MIAGYYKAKFDEFIWRDAFGQAHVTGRRGTSGRHRDRVWPALSRYRHARRRKARLCPARVARVSKAISDAALLTVLRRWDPYRALEAWHMKQCDRAQRPPRYDPW